MQRAGMGELPLVQRRLADVQPLRRAQEHRVQDVQRPRPAHARACSMPAESEACNTVVPGSTSTVTPSPKSIFTLMLWHHAGLGAPLSPRR